MRDFMSGRGAGGWNKEMRTGRPFDREEAKALWNEGWLIQDIAAHLETSVTAISKEKARGEGWETRKRPRPMKLPKVWHRCEGCYGHFFAPVSEKKHGCGRESQSIYLEAAA